MMVMSEGLTFAVGGRYNATDSSMMVMSEGLTFAVGGRYNATDSSMMVMSEGLTATESPVLFDKSGPS
jgi:3-deoxy-D-arabino-heptulosonate 7-phosphate (DAHP) synthase